LGLPRPGKAFELLSFDEFTEVLLAHPNAPKLAQTSGDNGLRGLLQQVRNARNKLAHFRGELSAEERRTIQFASEWLERNLPVPKVVTPAPVPEIKPSDPGIPAPQEDEDDAPKGSYAPLAEHLKAQKSSITSLSVTFQEIEDILGKELPRSAFEYRAWWANDPTKPQSAAWLDEGWRTMAISMSDRRLTFVRTTDREDAYIAFFAKLNAQLEKQPGFPLRNMSPQGQSWIILSSFQKDAALINAAFTRRKELRIELYLDVLFDQLYIKKTSFEAVVGEPLSWERLAKKRACRVAIYTKGQILTDADNPSLLDWATQKAVALYKAFSPEFPTT
jgi:hypothetical protein